MALWECSVHWIVCLYDGKIVLLLFREHIWGKKSTPQLCWQLWLTTIYGIGILHSGLQVCAMISISWMPVSCIMAHININMCHMTPSF